VVVKRSVYIETTIVSYLVGRSSRDLVAAANQALTREWWTARSQEFDLFASAVVIGEARDGDPELAARRVEILSRAGLLEVTGSALQLAGELLRRTGIPAKAQVDALHIAIAAIHGMDYLLTWNCKHIANAVTLPKVYAVCRELGYEPPFVCTPQELMEGY
jgi:hypothetical protein